MHNIRILHVLPRLSGGGVTNWLVRVARHLKPDEYQLDFAVHRSSDSPHLDELVRRGAKIFLLPNRRRIFEYLYGLHALLGRQPGYHVLHSHYHSFSGVVLLAALQKRVPVRIAHARTTSDPKIRASAKGHIACYAGRVLLRLSATHLVACSQQAANVLFGHHLPRILPLAILPGGIDVTQASSAPAAADYRAALDIPGDSLVVGHVGNFYPAKNHSFLLNVFLKLLQIRSDAHLILLGEGPLRCELEKRIAQAGLGNRVRLLGYRTDVAAVLQSTVDVFAFPSIYEGLGISVVEAQISGVPVVASLAVPEEALFSTDGMRLPLEAGPKQWAEAIAALAGRKPTTPASADKVTRFLIEHHAEQLGAIYRSGIAKDRLA